MLNLFRKRTEEELDNVYEREFKTPFYMLIIFVIGQFLALPAIIIVSVFVLADSFSRSYDTSYGEAFIYLSNLFQEFIM